MSEAFKAFTYRCDEDLKIRFDIALKQMRGKTASEEIRMAIERFVVAVESGQKPQLEIAVARKS
ncbi:hypothetical protein [Pseudomonas sp. DC3000-4b1]|uniref:hypothetical protein n=1 Tax=unclassified Pseudomonas TaxID=196821 RepID=UPI003CE8AC62